MNNAKNLNDFIEHNKSNILSKMEDGATILAVGPVGTGKTTLIRSIMKMVSDEIEEKSRYSSSLEVESLYTTRLIADKSKKVATLFVDYDNVTQCKKFLSTDISVAEGISRNASVFNKVISLYQDTYSEEPKKEAIKALNQLLPQEQVEKIFNESNMIVISCHTLHGDDCIKRLYELH